MVELKENEPRPMTEQSAHDLVLGLVKKYLPKAGKIIDVGAGEGAFARSLVNEGHSVIALDIDDSKLKTPEIELRLCDFNKKFVQNIFSEDEKFDAVIAIEVIEHLENPFDFVRECRKLLTSNGILIVTTPNVEAVNSRLIYLYTGRMLSFGEYETVPTGHITPVFAWKAEYLLREAGFKIIWQGYNEKSYYAGVGIKGKIGSLFVKMLEKIVKGPKGGKTLVVVAKVKDDKASV